MHEARSVFEFGTGTGRLAERLLRSHLPGSARYRGVDVSSTMVALARARLARWHDRAVVEQSDGSPRVAGVERGFDRFVSTYVLDLLSSADIVAVLLEAHRLLSDDGLLCLASATHGRTRLERVVMGAASRLHALSPAFVGGCRAIDLASYLEASRWRVVHRRVTSKWGIPSEVVVAAPRRAG
jgi:ubiquinone/menaquinone biosynthesis C-methylase UbiE